MEELLPVAWVAVGTTGESNDNLANEVDGDEKKPILVSECGDVVR